MGNILDRSRDDEIEEESVDQSSTHHGHHGYLYPPKSGFYFGSHFVMGGEKFETGSPEAYLFGDNMDLNFLGPKPIPFPYLAPLPDEPTRSLRVLVNIRKDTLRLIKIPTATITNESNQIDLSSNIITTSTSAAALTNSSANANEYSPLTINNSNYYKTSHNRLTSNGSIKQISTDHHELREFPTSSLSTTALATTSSSPQESSKSTTSSSSSLNSSTATTTTKPAQTQLKQETNRLLASSSTPIETPKTKSSTGPLYTIEFTFDSDVKCSVTIYYLAVEESTPNGNIYVPRDPTYKTTTYHYPMGAGQIFSQPALIFNPTAFNEDDLLYRAIDEYGNFDPTVPFPVVIQINAEEGSEPRQSHSLIATVERNNEKQFYIKPFKQKIVIDGLAYLIQEVYGIENKNPIHSTSNGKPALYSSDEEIEDNGSECVICMSESRDTLILPCRHLCLCNCCAGSLRYQANNCPICRSPFRALLQFRAVRKITNNAQAATTVTKETNVCTQLTTETLNTSLSSSSNNNQSNHPTSVARPTTTTSNPTNNNATTGGGDTNDTKSDTPPGYESISLIEALNGPTLVQSSSSRPGELGLYAFQSSFDEEDVAPLASIEATTKSISGSSQSMVLTKSSRDIRRQFNESSNSPKPYSNLHSRHHHPTKSSFSSLADIRYPVPSSSSSPKLGYRSKSISKSKLLMMANAVTVERSEEGGNGNEVGRRKGRRERSSESLTLWSQQGSPESSSEDQEKVKLLDQENYSHHNQPQYHRNHHNHNHHHPIQSQSYQPDESLISVQIESTASRSRRNHLRKRGSLCNDSELKALNSSSSSSRDSSNQQLARDSIDGLDINSINLTSTSYPDLFLQDGVDEQRFMDETDMLSVSTLDSVPNESYPTK